MKSIFLLLTLASLFGCKKINGPEIIEKDAQVIDGGPIAADGLGYYIRIEEGDEVKNLSPKNLPDSFKQKDIVMPVGVKFYYTGEKQITFCARCEIPVIHIVDIRRR
jgi:hypothetical protein